MNAIYCSNSGDDANDGSIEASAVASIARVSTLRLQYEQRGEACEIYFRRGDVWSDQVRLRVGGRPLPYVVGAYGTGVRPRLSVELYLSGGEFTVEDLDLQGGGMAVNGVTVLESSRFTISRCAVNGYGRHGMHVAMTLGVGSQYEVTDCEITDNGGQGVLGLADDQTVSGCTIRENGWVGGNVYSKFNHGVYMKDGRSHTMTGCTLDNNSSFGLKSSGGDNGTSVEMVTVHGNTFIDHFCAIDCDSSQTANTQLPDGQWKHLSVDIRDNVFHRTANRKVDASGQTRRHWAFDVRLTQTQNGVVQNNVFDAPNPSFYGAEAGSVLQWAVAQASWNVSNLTVSGNTVPAWTIEEKIEGEPVPDPDPAPEPQPGALAVDLTVDPLTWRVTGTITPMQ